MRSTVRRWLVPCFVAAFAMGQGQVAAQHCHAHAPVDGTTVGVRLAVSAEAATYSRDSVSGEYEALWAIASASLGRFQLRLALPTYRIVRNDEEDWGPGDFEFDARAALFGQTSGGWVGGVMLAGTLPTGSRDKDLGMGHVMLMPGVWLGVQDGPAFAYGQLEYGRALADLSPSSSGAGHEHHAVHVHGGPGPIVNPMNGSEVSAALTAGYWFENWVRGRTGVYGAVPVGVSEGVSRLALFLGGDLVFRSVDFGLEAHVRAVGQPFDLKLVLSAGVRF